MADQNDPSPLPVTMAVTSPVPICTVKAYFDPQHTVPIPGATIEVYTIDANWNKTLVTSGVTDNNGTIIFLLASRQGYLFHTHWSERVGGIDIFYDGWLFNDVTQDVTILTDVRQKPWVFFRNTNLGLSKTPPLVVNDAVDVTIEFANYGAPGVGYAKLADTTAGKNWEKRRAVATGEFSTFVVSIIVPPPRGNHSWTVVLGHEQ